MADGSKIGLEDPSEAWDNVSHWILQLPCVSAVGGEYKYLGDQQVVLNQWDNEAMQGNWLFLEQDVTGDIYRLEVKAATCGAEQAQYEAPTEEGIPSGAIQFSSSGRPKLSTGRPFEVYRPTASPGPVVRTSPVLPSITIPHSLSPTLLSHVIQCWAGFPTKSLSGCPFGV